MGGERSDGQMVLRRAGPDPTRPAPTRPDPLRLRRLWRRRRDGSGGREADRDPPRQTRPTPPQPAAGYDGGGAAVAEEERRGRRGAQTAVSFEGIGGKVKACFFWFEGLLEARQRFSFLLQLGVSVYHWEVFVLNLFNG